MATHSSILAWKIPWTEEPVRLQPMGLQKQSDMTQQLKNSSKYQRMHKKDHVSSLFNFYLLIYLFLVELGLHCYTLAFSSFGNGGYSLVVARGLLIVVASLLVEHRIQGAQASVVAAPEPQSVGSVTVMDKLSCSKACGIFPDQGSNPCPLAGGFLYTVTPSKSSSLLINIIIKR